MIEVHRLDAARRADFWRIHRENDAGWCACVAWWVPTWDGWGERTAEENRALRASLFESGEHDGYIAYDGGEPAAWCQVGVRDRLPKLRAQYRLDPDPETWAVTCFVVPPAARGRGVARALLDGAIADLRARGVRRLEAFPRRGDHLPADDAWTGPERLFLSAGFVLARDDATWPVYAKIL